MGYTTEFDGAVTIDPPLNEQEIQFLRKFSGTRRMNRHAGPYFVDAEDDFGQGRSSDIIDYNRPSPGQPGLWCQWVPTDDGSKIEWDGNEKFYDSVEWMKYLIDHFLSPTAIAKDVLPFLQANHTVNGEIFAQGEETSDRWKLVVEDNKVSTRQGYVAYND